MRLGRRSIDSAGFSGQTAWARNLASPLRDYFGTETGSAIVLLAAALAALVWANVSFSSYDAFWTTRLSIHVGDWGISQTLRLWVSNGLMAIFFLVVGLEARREFDLGELRERRRGALPLLAGVGGMVTAVAIYSAINAGRSSIDGWGAAMSTDTAFALGVLAFAGPRAPGRVRTFLLTVVVVDDIVALVVIATMYTESVSFMPLVVAALILGVTFIMRMARVRIIMVYALLGAAMWVAVYESGIDPLVVGLIFGLMSYAYPAARTDLERATEMFRSFREQPTPQLARSARVAVETVLSPNDRLQQMYHPWSAYVIVPLFALANAGIRIDRSLLSDAVRSPITLGIFFGYVVGKPVGIAGTTWLATVTARGRVRLPVGWGAVAGSSTAAGIGFTLSLLIADHAFSGRELDEAKIGVLGAALTASALTWTIFRAIDRLPLKRRLRALAGDAEVIIDLADPVDAERDHIRGPEDAKVTLLEYGDFECPYCGRAEAIVRELLADFGDLRYVWRHLPLTDVHPNAQLAAEASEAAAAQGAFWEMHDMLIDHQDALKPRDLIRYAESIGVDVERFAKDLRNHAGAGRVAEDVDSADLSQVSGTPTFFVNGRRHYGAYDVETLSKAVRAARARALLASG